jgi:hypothetical protein
MLLHYKTQSRLYKKQLKGCFSYSSGFFGGGGGHDAIKEILNQVYYLCNRLLLGTKPDQV